jgi:hypothetical protein
MKVQDEIISNDLGKNKKKIIFQDDAGFHGFSENMQILEDSDNNIIWVHNSGMLSMINSCEFAI